MKKILLLLIVLLINGAHDAVVVEGRPHRHRHRRDDYMLFVFGDSLADAGNGNGPPTADKTWWSRQWFYPYGSSDSAHGNRATGRSSDGLVQSDFLAMMLGQEESPPPYSNDEEVDASGLNFAMAGSTVTAGSQQGAPPSLGDQIDQLRRLVSRGIIDDGDLKDSVALIAFSCLQDYSGLNVAATDDDIMALADKVTDKIVDGVERLQELGVSKVIVDSMPPIGCQPYRTWMTNYGHCDSDANRISSLHNAALKRKLEDDVLVLDLDSMFIDLIQSKGGRPCCDGTSKPEGYCGQDDANGRPQYSLCSNPEDFFYWDYVHPTQAGWKAVMDRFQRPILNFLDI